MAIIEYAHADACSGEKIPTTSPMRKYSAIVPRDSGVSFMGHLIRSKSRLSRLAACGRLRLSNFTEKGLVWACPGNYPNRSAHQRLIPKLLKHRRWRPSGRLVSKEESGPLESCERGGQL